MAKKTTTTGKRTSAKKTPAKKKPVRARSRATTADALTQMQAAERVLERTGEPMNCGEMIEAMAEQGLWSSPNGKTPAATLYASLLRHIKKHGRKSRFKKTGPGRFTLR